MKTEESKLQIECVKWFRLRFREPKYLIFSIPNGGSRNLITAKILKAEGTRAGMPDLCVMTFDRIFFIEMKYGKGTQKPSQKEIESMLTDMNYTYYICRSFDEFRIACESELGSVDLKRDKNEKDEPF